MKMSGLPLRKELEKKGALIGNMDLMIAAHRFSETGKYILVTNNLREFQRVDGLACENRL